MSRVSIRCLAWGAVVLALAAGAPVYAEEGTIRKGIDAWSTVAGMTHTSFKEDPIPAGFFCLASKAFTGTVSLKGVPLATKPAKSLGAVDTVVSRLDDAAFDARGVATTRIQLSALSLASVEPIQTECGAYDVKVSLHGEQPKTTMRIVRTEARGGRYEAPLALNVKVVFTPVDGNRNGPHELVRRVELGPGTSSVWTYAGKPRYEGPIFIDSDGDGAPDLQVRGDSNFLAGVSPMPEARPVYIQSCPPGTCRKTSCHCNPDESQWTLDLTDDGCADNHRHCVWGCVESNSVICEEVPSPTSAP
ncbi:MAG TPA: hypothetical protein VGG03_05920 [Thermoanaerobaculia bacterium]|jgi:hypothetical protein